MQKLVRVKLSVEEYVREQFHKQMRPPLQCPNCGNNYCDSDTGEGLAAVPSTDSVYPLT